MYEWMDFIDSREQPDFESKDRLNSDVIWLNQDDPKFRDKCGSSCILVIRVDGLSTSVPAHYLLLVTRDILELIDNLKIED